MSDALNKTKVAAGNDKEMSQLTSSSESKRRREGKTPKTDGNDTDDDSSSFDGTLKPAPFFYYVDRSEEKDKDPLAPIIPIGHRVTFPCRMHVILDNEDFADIISWMPHGRSFQIHKPKEFVSEVIPQFWGKCTLPSFLRQVNYWGFLRLAAGRDQNCYYHEYFLRGLPHLCKKMKRRVKVSNKMGKRDYEPDLYAISKLCPLPQNNDSYHLDMLKRAVLDGPGARMTVIRGRGGTQEETTQDSNTLLVSSSSQGVQPPPQQQVHSQTEEQRDTIREKISQEPLPPQVHSQQQQSEEIGSGIESLQDGLERQQQLLSWQAFLFPVIQMGFGNPNTWRWLTNWWSEKGTFPIFLNEFERITEQERASADADVFGTAAPWNGLSSEDQKIALSLLRKEINNLDLAEKIELMEASTRSIELADNKLPLLFLQTEYFNAKSAANRVAMYWRIKVETFGRERAFLPFTIKNNFTNEGVRTLSMGLHRILPVSDCHGRTIIVIEPGRIHGKGRSIDELKQGITYMYHAALERPDTVRNGVVIIVSNKTSKRGHENVQLVTHNLGSLRCVPFRVKALHLCYMHRFNFKLFFPVMKYLMNPYLRQRVVAHNGEGDELLGRLRRYGMPPERLPIDLGGMIELDQEKWVADRLANGL